MRLEQVVSYAQTGACRWRALLEAFEERPSFQRCGGCDNCRRMSAFDAAQPADEAPPGATGPASGPVPPPPAHPAPPARFQAGDAVRVRRYGAGVVTAATPDAITVDFGGRHSRCFHPDFVRAGRATQARRPSQPGAGP
jgi:ATP-dependent DNA helicase RecQ